MEQKYKKYKKKYLRLKNKQDDGLLSPLEIKNTLVDGLLELYTNYYDLKLKEYKNVYVIGSIKGELDRIKANPELLKNIKIDFTLNEIKKNFTKYGIIILRNPAKSDLLILGCGNKSVDPDPELVLHEHIGFTTIYEKLTMNPTIVGAFGDDKGINIYLKQINHKFKDLYFEGSIIFAKENANNEYPLIDDFLKNIMKKNFHNFGVEKITDFGTDMMTDFGTGIDGFYKSYAIYTF